MNPVPKAERLHIAIVGNKNAGKSSLVNALLGQDLCITSSVPGTTTHPVKKSIELLPFGPVVLVDTAGIDDNSEAGIKRITKTIKTISLADVAIVVLDARNKLSTNERELFEYLTKISLPFLIGVNKIELGINSELLADLKNLNAVHFEISCKENVGIDRLKSKLIRLLPAEKTPSLLADLVGKGDVIVLVVPPDPDAPKGRLILPQVKAIYDALDEDTVVIVTKDQELRSALNNLTNLPDLVITDSQSIMKVNADVPEEVKLTTFSILMAKYKGDLPEFVRALKKVEELQDGDKILIAEACSNHSQEDDTGRSKIPGWLRLHTKKNLEFEISSGLEFPDNLSKYKLIIHCSGCMVTRKALLVRIKEAKLLDIPIVNYGVLISYLQGGVPRAIQPFADAVAAWENCKFSRAN